MPIKAVLFDLGDTLIFQAHTPDPAVLFSEMALRAQPLLDAWGVDLPIDLATLLNEISLAVETAQPGRRARGLEVDGAFIARGALATHGIDVSAERANAFWRATAVEPEIRGHQAYPDSVDTVRRVRALGLPVAIVCNGWFTSDLIAPYLDAAGIPAQLFDAVVSSADMMRPKPRPEPFVRALALLGVAAADAVFVGDDLDADVRGAKALGMTTVWKLNGRHELDLPPEADHAIHDLWELFTLDLLPGSAEAALPRDSLMPHEDSNADRY